MNYGKNSLVLCGGGIDSYVAAWDNQLGRGQEGTTLLYIDYGAKSRQQEIKATEQLRLAMCKKFGQHPTSMVVIEFDLWSRYLNSPLTDDTTPVNHNPRSGVAHEWVPARNTVLMAVALSIAESKNFARIVCGINVTAAKAYPDNDVEWLERWRKLVEYSVNKDRKIELCGPVADLSKRDIINRAHEIGMTQEILGHSWSCYEGTRQGLHCGRCSSCRSRKLAFNESLWHDPTKYADRSK